MQSIHEITKDLRFRDMTIGDIPAGLRLCRASGWNQLEEDWRLFLRLNPPGCRVVERNEQVIGTVSTIRYEDRFSWLSMVLVDLSERGVGIGTRLLHEGLALLQDQRCVRLDATPAGRQIYQRHGFVPEYTLNRVVGTADPERLALPPEAARPMREEDLSEVLATDAQVFGARRDEIIVDLFHRAPQYAWVSEKNGRLRGHVLGRPGFLYEHLGPIVARDLESALSLTAACLRSHPGRTFAVDASAFESGWMEWLMAHGFVEERPFIRMCRGDNRYPGIPAQQFAIVGPEFG
jgi:GNAT superfamily N-acetyltransferase